MDALLKDRYSILEAVDLIARDHENLTKDFIRNFLLSDRPMEISDAIERAVYIRKQTGYQDYNGRQALDRISLSRDELERCSEYLGRTYPKESPAPKSAKRGRPKSHDQRKRDIEKATAE